MFNFKLICVVIYLFIYQGVKLELSDKRLCANKDCTQKISLARTLMNYPSPDKGVLSFKANTEAVVYSKSAGSNMNLWGVEINGVRGYVPHKLLRETKIFTKQLDFLIDTEATNQLMPSLNNDESDTTIKVSKVPEPIILDGTTFYDDTIAPTSTANVILATETLQDAFTENKKLDLDSADINHQETEPLDSKVETVENNDYINENSIFSDKKSAQGGDNKVEVESKEDSITGAILRTIVDFIGDDRKDDKEADVDDESEEDDEYDEEEEEDEIDEDEEFNDVNKEDSNGDIGFEVVDTGKNGENKVVLRQLLSDEDISGSYVIDAQQLPEEIVEGNKKETKGTIDNNEDKVKFEQILTEEDILENPLTDVELLPKEIVKIDEEKTKIVDAVRVSENNDEVKLKQLLSEEGVSRKVLTVVGKVDREKTKNLDGFDGSESSEDEVRVAEENGLDNLSVETPSHTNNEGKIANDEAVSRKDTTVVVANQEERASISTNSTGNLETVTESAYDQIPDLEVPAPHIHHDFVTPNPLKLNLNELISDAPNGEEIAQHDEQNKNAEAQAHIESENVQRSDEQSLKVELNVDNEKLLPLNTQSLENSEEAQSDQKRYDKMLENVDSSVVDNIEDVGSSLDVREAEGMAIPDATLGFKEDNQLPASSSHQDKSSGSHQDSSSILDEVGNFSRSIDVTKKGESTNIIEDQGESITKSIDNEDARTNPSAENKGTLEKHEHDFLSAIGEDLNTATSTGGSYSIYEEITEALTRQIVPGESTELNDTVDVTEKTVEVPVITEIPKDFEETVEQVRNDVIIEQSNILETPGDELQQGRDFGSLGDSHILDNQLLSKNSVDYGSCPAGESDCPSDVSVVQNQLEMEEIDSSSIYMDFMNLFTLLGVTGFSVAVFLLGFIKIDKNRKEGSLIAKINTLEKALLVASKENALLTDRVVEVQNENVTENERISTEEYEHLNKVYQETLVAKSLLEEQIQSLEKELENSTEVGLELNRMLSDILSSQNGSDTLIANVEQLQRQLVEQQSTINTINDSLNLKDTENHELRLELEIKNKKVTHLQTELDKMAMNLFKAEEDKEQTQARLEGEIVKLKDQIEKNRNVFNMAENKLSEEIVALKTKVSELQRNLDVKSGEYDILKENFNKIKTIKNNTEALESLLNASAMKAELQQLQRDNQGLRELLTQEQQTKLTLEKQIEIAIEEARSYKARYEESDREKLEAKTKLEVLSNYFKEKEAQLQKELSKQESMWVEKQGETTTTVERIRYMQEELQNFKSQNESLKQEIVAQEVELKSQISVLEKKAHDSWVLARQAERRLEDAKQEAAQLRNRLTLKERSFIEDKNQNRMQSPLEQNGDVAISPLHAPVDTPASPPLLYGTRDHMTTSPPLPNLPPFLPPPPGVPFMPPPPLTGVPPGFMPPPPPSMFPGDHRPPPLGRMSPPIGSRYSPDSRYSPYDRNTPSPPYDDEYGSSPPPHPPVLRGYSPYNSREDRRDYKRAPPPLRSNGRNKGGLSSGSGNSNESLEKISRHHSKV